MLRFSPHGDEKTFAFTHGHGHLLTAFDHGGGFDVLQFEWRVRRQVAQQLHISELSLIANKPCFLRRYALFNGFEQAWLYGCATLECLARHPHHAGDRVVLGGGGDLGTQACAHLHHHKMLPNGLGTAGTHALFVAKRLVKHDVLAARFNFDAVVHGHDVHRGRFHLVGVHHKLLGTLLQRRPSRIDSCALGQGLTPGTTHQHACGQQAFDACVLQCLKSSAQHLQDGLQGCECFDVFRRHAQN